MYFSIILEKPLDLLSASDGVLHSRQLHSLALNGDFGAIAVAPNPLNTDSSG